MTLPAGDREGGRWQARSATANTPRQRMPAARRHHIFSENCTAHDVAPCCICGRPVHRYDDKWIIEHKRALGLLGADTNTNCGPAHEACAKVKTYRQDLPAIAKAKRQQQAGAKKAKRGFKVPAGAVCDWTRRRYVAQRDREA